MNRLTPIDGDEPSDYLDALTGRSHRIGDPVFLGKLVKRLSEYPMVRAYVRTLPATAPQILARRAALESLYTSKQPRLVQIRKDIRALATQSCPYCGTRSRPKTLDHFLPISEFPEFSMYFLNLLPCCRDCNSEKLAKFWDPGTGRRSFIHPYLDKTFSRQFLRVRFDPSHVGLPYDEPAISLDLVAASAEEAETCRLHFERLKLFEQLPGKLLKQYRVIRRLNRRAVAAGRMTVAMLEELLIDYEESHSDEWGQHCPEALVARGIRQNPAVLNFVATQPIARGRP